MKRLLILIALVSSTFSQDLNGVRICIDPGHSGHESDDRYMAATGFWESESNLTKGLELRSILLGLGAEVAITRTGNNDTSDDLGLSERAGVANAFNADYFNSNHSNGFNGTANYAMVIYNGTTSSPTFPLARTMANIMAPLLDDVNQTTHDISIGDLTLNPTWTYGYGVLVPANMPATISEGSFHDYIPESWRLMNLDYRKHEAMALARSYLAYFGQPGFSVGAIAGLVRNPDVTVSYFALASLEDQYQPINNIEVSIEPGGYHYSGGENNNGYFKVDSLTPGIYEVIITAEGFSPDTSSVTVTANQTSFTTIQLLNTTPPTIVESHPAEGDSLWTPWSIPYFDFSKAMNRTSVEESFTIEPAAVGTFHFTQDSKRMAFILTDSLDFFTDYTITFAATATDMAGFPLDGNQDGIGGDDWSVSFRTIARDVLALDETGVKAPFEFALQPNYPNPFNPSTSIPFTLPQNAEVSIRVFDLQGQEVYQIMNATMSAGRYVTHWDASKVSSGLYLIKMDANEFSITRKITVLK
ncbi:MAG: N-acetylmuramoyl-L-alanine amidase [FCB group bacterium]|nr:N-acetylmuramoyl-L-alanine amidase [FCB group bacterium]MBL7028581.1 N-acetylmuramoyl-L-alanine amidase [Candidatus Neomarinimicrobiota bacterium]MBL7120800.1 N-acetylmuramoyl-L-alanine amidase [Candidatus Neomarinimicrobiota bacterium]